MSAPQQPAPTFGPRQQTAAKHEAEMVALWSRDLEAAVAAGDLVKVQALTACMGATLDRLGKLAARAARGR